MIETRPGGDLACIGYAEFCARARTDAGFADWLTHLSASVEELAKGGDPSHPRLVALQHNLVDLLDLLDPDGLRFPDRHRSKLGLSPLTPRETQMLSMLAEYKPVEEIAEQLQITLTTANARLWTLTQKLGVRTSPEAVELAVQKGWL